jgi:hypothetical protein
VGWLAGIVGKELGEILQRAILGFGGILQDLKLLRGGVDLVEAVAGGGEGEDVGNRNTGKENMRNKLGRKVFEQHGGSKWNGEL